MKYIIVDQDSGEIDSVEKDFKVALARNTWNTWLFKCPDTLKLELKDLVGHTYLYEVLGNAIT